MWDLDNNVQVSHWCKGKELPQSWCCFCSFYRVLWYHILYASYHKQAAGGSTSQCSITFVHNLDSILWEDHNKNIVTISTTSILIHLIADFSWGSTFHVKHTCYCSIYLQFACIFWIGGWEQFNSPTIFFLYEVQLQLPEAQLQMLLATVNYVRLATCLWKNSSPWTHQDFIPNLYNGAQMDEMGNKTADSNLTSCYEVQHPLCHLLVVLEAQLQLLML